MKLILSIDGGGVRGILPASALVAIEAQLGKPVREVFSFIAGTSTGALIAAACAAGVPATRILGIYTERSKEIFNHSPAIALSLRLARGWAYDPRTIRRVLASEFGAAANWTLNDSPVKLLLTAKRMNKRPLYFVPDNPKNARTMGKFFLIDCAVASASATTYFDAYNVPGVGLCYDGGLGVVGNPAAQACVEAFRYDAYDPADTRIVSLGTGFFPESDQKPSGLIAEVGWVLDSLLNSPEDEQTFLVHNYYPGIMQRFNWKLPEPIDMASVSSIPKLTEIGKGITRSMDWSKVL